MGVSQTRDQVRGGVVIRVEPAVGLQGRRGGPRSSSPPNPHPRLLGSRLDQGMLCHPLRARAVYNHIGENTYAFPVHVL